MDIYSSIVLGVVEGLTEFLPISSSGHLIIARDILGLATPNALSIDAILQFGTILAVFVYFFKDLWRILLSAIRFVFRKPIDGSQRVLLGALVVGTVPGVLFGLFLEKTMDTVFRSAFLVACMLIVGSILMYMAEKVAKQTKPLSIQTGFIIGLFQSLALVPGISRSGATISGGLIAGLSREEATRFSFILSFPIIVGAGVKKLYELYQVGDISVLGLPLFVSTLVAFLVGLASIHFLIRYLKTHSLSIFIYYRVILALLVFGALFLF